MKTACPKCGSSDAWNGSTCRKCDLQRDSDQVVRGLDRILAVVFFALLGVFACGVIGIVVGGWEMFKGTLVGLLFGMDISDVPWIFQLSVPVGLGLGLILGGWFGWQVGRKRKSRARGESQSVN